MPCCDGAHFYVTLKDEFPMRCSENHGFDLFDDLDNPWEDARERLTYGRLYPVLAVGEKGHSLTVIDDSGRQWSAATGLFKYAAERLQRVHERQQRY